MLVAWTFWEAQMQIAVNVARTSPSPIVASVARVE
jgi:hypothetical protein